MGGLSSSPLLPEAHILSDLLAGYKRATFQWNKTSRFYASETQLTDFYRKLAEHHIHDVELRYANANYIVLKNPDFAGLINEAMSLLTDIRCIVVVRDPRDIVASYIKIGQRESLPSCASSHSSYRSRLAESGFRVGFGSNSFRTRTAVSRHRRWEDCRAC